MRKGHVVIGLTVLGFLGLAGWATLGTAQPGYNPIPNRPLVPKPIVEAVPPVKEAVPPMKVEDPPVIRLPDSASTPVGKPSPEVAPPAIVDPYEVQSQPMRLNPEAIKVPEAPVKTNESPMKVLEPVTKTDPPLVEVKIEDSAAKPLVIPAENTMRPEGSVSATQPAVSLEWSGPGTVKVGAPNDYVVTVRNTAATPVQKVVVQVRLPANVAIAATEPKAENNDNVLMWDLGNLLAKQERKLLLKLSAPQRGDVSCQAWVTFTGSSVMKVQVREPKLAVKVQAPERVLISDPANIVMTVSNPGDHPADKVKIAALLGEGLESIKGNMLNYEIGTLAAGESRTITVPCVTKSAGAQKCDIFVEAEGGLKAGDTATTNVIQPRLDLVVAGPKLRYLDRKAAYGLKITNPGDAAASNVFITQVVPSGFKFVQADSGGQYDEANRSIKWFIGELAPTQSKEVKCELMAIATGDFTHKVMAHASRGMKSEQEIKTAVEGLSAILMEVIDIEDPIEVGGETAYEIRITNTGSKAEDDVKLICTIPPQMKLKNVSGPVKYEVVGNEVVFQALPQLSPRADAVFKITMTAAAKGDARFKASLTTASLVDPVIKVEPTKVYAE